MLYPAELRAREHEPFYRMTRTVPVTVRSHVSSVLQHDVQVLPGSLSRPFSATQLDQERDRLERSRRAA